MTSTTGPEHPKKIGFRLQSKFLAGIVVLECLIMVATILVVEKQMRESILTEFLKRGFAIGQNLAALNANYIATFNYVSIEQAVAKVTEENDLAYAAVQLFDGEIAGFGGSELFRKAVFEDGVNKASLSATRELVRYLRFENMAERICDITTPVYLKEKKWATVRIGMSMKYIRESVHKTRITLLTLGGIILLASSLLSIFLARDRKSVV